MTRSLERTRAFSVSFAQEASFTGIPLCRRTLPDNTFPVAGTLAVVLGVADMLLLLDGGGAGVGVYGCVVLMDLVYMPDFC